MTAKIKLIRLIVFGIFAIFWLRAFYLQILNGQIYQRQSFLQSYQIEKIQPPLGQIISRDQTPLTLNQTVWQLSIYKPNLAINQQQLIDQFNIIQPGYADSQLETINQFFDNSQQKWITLKKPITDYQLVDQLAKIDGISLNPVVIRYYPEKKLAQEVLSGDSGTSGLLGYYHRQLSGQTGFIWQTKDSLGRPIFSRLNWSKPMSPGQNINVSLDRLIQYQLEKELEKANLAYQSQSAMGVIMHTTTGQILAMSTKDASPSASLTNRIVQDIYEPGSIFKPITLAIALDSQAIDLNFVCQQCQQNRTINNHQIKNWNLATYPDSNVYDIIKNSDNIGMTYIMDQINLDTFLDYSNKLLLTKKTNIDLQSEARSQFVRSYWSELDKATASFGQGIAITPIQAITAFNTIGNGGLLVKPHFNLDNPKFSSTETVFSTSTTKAVLQILEYGQKNSSLAKLNTNNLSVCGKSGTAQVAEDGSYGQNTYASYIGFYPCFEPKYTMLIIVKHPTTTPWGATTAAPIWFSLASQIKNYVDAIL